MLLPIGGVARLEAVVSLIGSSGSTCRWRSSTCCLRSRWTAARVLRAALAMRLDYARATQVAATIGQGVAILFGVLGFSSDPLLIFIALFVWFGAAQEANQVQVSRDSEGGVRHPSAAARGLESQASRSIVSRKMSGVPRVSNQSSHPQRKHP